MRDAWTLSTNYEFNSFRYSAFPKRRPRDDCAVYAHQRRFPYEIETRDVRYYRSRSSGAVSRSVTASCSSECKQAGGAKEIKSPGRQACATRAHDGGVGRKTRREETGSPQEENDRDEGRSVGRCQLPQAFV